MSGAHDFDFLAGRWAVRHRRLRERGKGSDDWEEVAGTAHNRVLIGGLCNVEEHVIPGTNFGELALRTFEPAAGIWTIYWVSGRDGALQQPVRGGFSGDSGLFEGLDSDQGRAVRIRFRWDRLGADKARWEQAFCYAGDAEWETNWIMSFERPSP